MSSLLIQQIGIKYLLGARHCFRFWPVLVIYQFRTNFSKCFLWLLCSSGRRKSTQIKYIGCQMIINAKEKQKIEERNMLCMDEAMLRSGI